MSAEPSFFPPVPVAGDVDDHDVTPPHLRWSWLGPPEGELPGGVDSVLAIGSSPTAVVPLEALRGFSTGITFDLTIRIREHARRVRAALFDALGVHHGRGQLDLLLPQGGLRFGMEFSDGSRVTTLDESPWDLIPVGEAPPGWEPPGPLFDGVARPRSQGQTWQRTVWLWPVPPPGDITVVCAWPDRQIAETRSVVPAAPLIQACGNAAALWS